MSKKLILQRMLRSKFFMTGAIAALIVLLFTFIGPALTPFNPESNSMLERLTPPDFSKGLNGHIFGTDELGRDIFARLVYGARYSLAIAAVTLFFSVLLGVVLGVVAGYFGGIVDTVIMRLTEVFMSLPSLVLAIAIVAVLGANIPNLIIVLVLTGWTGTCKIARNNVLVQKNMDYIHASQVMGASQSHIMFTQILPNILTPLIITASQHFGMIILMESSLSFLSLGIQQPTPSWGNMIAGGRTFLTICPWMVIAPGAALMVTVLAFNFLGDGLRDVLDPKRI